MDDEDALLLVYRQPRLGLLLLVHCPHLSVACKTGKAKAAPVISEDMLEERIVTDEASVLELLYLPRSILMKRSLG